VTTNVDPAEIAKFEALASRWWDPEAEFKPLHDINPIRMNFIDSHTNVAQLKIADIGCGGGILTETLAKRGAIVTGIDMTNAPLKVAQLHALEQELTQIQYEQKTAEQLAAEQAGQFNVITCMEMLEHVPDPDSIVQSIYDLLKPGGKAFFSTINRTPKAFALAIVGAEYVMKLMAKGTHEYRKLIRPSELAGSVRSAGFKVLDMKGMHYNPFTRHCRLTEDVSVNYLMAVEKPVA
jgi:2-polyprenyl-6-hydroxyphenyl methylase / 3-demethylubiquinone-9 3-methyltransferase